MNFIFYVGNTLNFGHLSFSATKRKQAYGWKTSLHAHLSRKRNLAGERLLSFVIHWWIMTEDITVSWTSSLNTHRNLFFNIFIYPAIPLEHMTIWSLSLHQGSKKTHKNRTSNATKLHACTPETVVYENGLLFKLFKDACTFVTTYTFLPMAPLCFLAHLPRTTLLYSFSLWRREMLEGSAMKSLTMAKYITINSVDNQILFLTPPLTQNYQCFRDLLFCSNKRLVFLWE